MTPSEAKLLLSYHSGRNADTENPKWATGFLGSLRPYRGHLIEENSHEVIACIHVLAPSLTASPLIERNTVNDVMGIVHLGRAWGVNKRGMLRANSLIHEPDWRKLEEWVDIIAYTFIVVLDTDNAPEAYSAYDDYVRRDHDNDIR